MTRVRFFADSKGLYGFEISGHCSENSEDETGRLVCAAVSSAAYMAVNTVTDAIGDKGSTEIKDGSMRFTAENPCEATYKVMYGLKLHLEALSEDYSNSIKIYGGADDVKN